MVAGYGTYVYTYWQGRIISSTNSQAAKKERNVEIFFGFILSNK
jgi:hypothetical protein